MKLTKLAHSCIVVEEAGTKLLIDPGYLLVDEKTLSAWKEANFILVTHKHADHFDEASVKKILALGAKIYATKETAAFYPNTKFEIIKEKDSLKLGPFEIEVVKALHGYLPQLKGGKEADEAIGFIITCQGKKIYHTGDTICFPNDYKCDIILLPYNNHGVCMGPFEAALFAKATEAKLVLPIHEHSPAFPADKEKFKIELEKNKLNYKFLNIGETIEP